MAESKEGHELEQCAEIPTSEDTLPDVHMEPKLSPTCDTLEDKHSRDDPFERSGIYIEQGANVNIIQAQRISDSVLQGSSGMRHWNGGDAAHPLNNEMDFDQYFKRFSGSQIFFSMLTVASLEAVEESRLNELAVGLRQALIFLLPSRGEDANEECYPDSPVSQVTLMRLAHLEPCTIQKHTNVGVLELSALKLESTKLGEQVRRWFWTLFPQFREPFTKWLISLALANSYPVGTQARQALANYATLDFGYTYGHILPQLSSQVTLPKVSCLTLIMRSLTSEQKYRGNAARLLQTWLSARNCRLWMVPLQLYAQEKGDIGQDEISAFLLQLFKNEIYPEGSFPEQREAEQYILGLAQRSQPLRNELISTLSRWFREQRNQKERRLVAWQFLRLLQADYLMENKRYPDLQLLTAMADPAFREELGELLRCVWQKVELRKIFQKVLLLYLDEHSVNEVSLTYLRCSLYRCAFTGFECDYNNTLYFLKKLHGQAGTNKLQQFALETEQWLRDKLERQRSI